MLEIKVTVEVPGLPEAINALAAAMIGAKAATILMPVNPATAAEEAAKNGKSVEKIENPTAPAAPLSTPANAEAASAATTGPATASSPSKAYTLDDLSRAGATLIDQGKMPQLLELLKKYGVQAVTQLNASVYPAFVDEMKALGAQL